MLPSGDTADDPGSIDHLIATVRRDLQPQIDILQSDIAAMGNQLGCECGFMAHSIQAIERHIKFALKQINQTILSPSQEELDHDLIPGIRQVHRKRMLVWKDLVHRTGDMDWRAGAAAYHDYKYHSTGAGWTRHSADDYPLPRRRVIYSRVPFPVNKRLMNEYGELRYSPVVVHVYTEITLPPWSVALPILRTLLPHSSSTALSSLLNDTNGDILRALERGVQLYGRDEYASVQQILRRHFPKYCIPGVLLRFAYKKKRMQFLYRGTGLGVIGAPTEDTLVEWALLSGDRRVKAAAEPLRDMLFTARRHVRAQRRWRYLSTLIRTCSIWTHALTPEARAKARREAPTRTISTIRRERRPIARRRRRSQHATRLSPGTKIPRRLAARLPVILSPQRPPLTTHPLRQKNR